MRTKRKIGLPGVSLIEIMFSLSLFGLILLSLSQVIRSGYNYYWETAGSLEVQKAVLYGTKLLGQDLKLSSSRSVEITDILEPDSQGVSRPMDDILFASPLDANDQRRYNSRGNLQWQSYFAYYVAPLGQSKALFKQRQAVASPGVVLPVPSIDGVTALDLKALPSPKLILKDVDQFDCEMSATDADLVKVRLTGFFEQRGLFSITVENQYLPRN